MSLLRTILHAFLALGTAVGVAQTNEDTEHLTAEDRKLFAWFDQLGIEDLSHARLVRVCLGEAAYPEAPGTHQLDEPRAFLLWEKGGHFRVVLGDLTAATLEPHGTDRSQPDYIGWRAVTLDEEAEAFVRKPATDGGSHSIAGDDYIAEMDFLDPRGQAFVLARFCAMRNREDLAVRLMRAIKPQTFKSPGSDRLEFDLESDFERALTRRATLNLADLRLDRNALAAQFQSIADHVPSPFSTEAATQAVVLRKMAAEDEAHRKTDDRDFTRLSPAEQANELVYQLRDECIAEEDGWSRPWPFERTKGGGSLRKLIALGWPAVPALLDALGDDRPSRTVHRSFGLVYTDPVQFLAGQALSEIAGVDFYTLIPDDPGLPKLDDPLSALEDANPAERWKKVRLLVEDWWKTTREEGDIEWFRRQIANGTDGGHQCVAAVSLRHPDIFPDFAIEMTPLAPDVFRRAEMIQMLSPTNTAKVNAFLRDEMKREPALIDRVAAAYVLREHHQAEGLEAMSAEFETLKPSLMLAKAPDGSTPKPLGEDPYSANAPTHILYFLLSSDSPSAIEKMRVLLPHCPTSVRTEIISGCWSRWCELRPGPVEPASAATLDALEALLIFELQDQELLTYGFLDRKPRVADDAAAALAAGWPEKYHYDPLALPETRASQIATMRTQYDSSLKASNKALEPKH